MIDQPIKDLINKLYGTIDNITKVYSGLTNQVFIVNTCEKKLVLKILNSNFTQESKTEIAVNKLLSNLHITPLITYNGWPSYYISTYVESYNSQGLDFSKKETIYSLTNTLYTLHSLNLSKISLKIKTLNIHQISCFYLNSYLYNNSNIIPLTVNLNEKLLIIIQDISKRFPPHIGLCHNDLNLDNLIINTSGKLILLDFEYIAYNDICFDLASLWLVLPESMRGKWLNMYYKHNLTLHNLTYKEFVDKTLLYSYVVIILSITWYLYMYSNLSLKEDTKQNKLLITEYKSNATKWLNKLIYLLDKTNY